MPNLPKVNTANLLKRATHLIKSDLEHIRLKVEQGKLSDKEARDLVNYVKLLSDIEEEKKRDEEKRKKDKEKLTDDEIRKLLDEQKVDEGGAS